MDESVGDGGGGGGVVEELSPVLEGEVGGDDGRGALIALVEDLVEQIGAAGVEGQVSQLVDEQEVVGGPSREAPGEGVACLGGDELVDEIGGEGETHAVAAQAGELAESVGEVGFPDAGGSEKDDVGALAYEVERGRARDQIAIDAVGVIEVIGVEGGERKQAGALEGGAGARFELHAELIAHEPIEQGGGRIVSRDGLLEGGIELDSSVIEPEGLEHVGEREGGESFSRRSDRVRVSSGLTGDSGIGGVVLGVCGVWKRAS